jgi:hypothetical protein
VREIPAALLMCAAHWSFVPAEIRYRVTVFYRRYKQSTDYHDDYKHAVDDAVAAVKVRSQLRSP